jgi:hypothetical protein
MGIREAPGIFASKVGKVVSAGCLFFYEKYRGGMLSAIFIWAKTREFEPDHTLRACNVDEFA